MSEFITRRVDAYVERVRAEATVAYGAGKIQVDPRAVREIVRDEPREVTELVIRMQVTAHREGPASRLQLALLLAELYQDEFGDDRMVDLVRDAAGGQAIPFGTGTADGGYHEEEARLGPLPPVRVLTFENYDPQEGDVRHVVRVFGDIEREPSRARALRGLVTLSFPRYDDDPREYFAVPEVRACIAALDGQLPHFLYYLLPSPQVGQIVSYVNSLLPQELFDFLPGVWQYTGPAEELLGLLITRLQAVRRFCQVTGDDPEQVTSSILESYPAFGSALGDALRSAGEP